ncbi:MAG: hypothetical protein JWO98_2572, partial [Frankiales bacterium]|nr:hypothetical protein [Frankiales bacterium]
VVAVAASYGMTPRPSGPAARVAPAQVVGAATAVVVPEAQA